MQKYIYRQSIEALPLIIFCEDVKLTDSLITELKQKNYVALIEVDDNQKIGEILIREYGLSEAQEILRNHSLPYVIKVYFVGMNFNIPEKADLRDFLLKNEGFISWKYNDDYWSHFMKRIQLLHDVYLYANILIALILFIFGCYFRVRSEIKRDSYWNIYRAAGGSFKKRELYFWIHSLYLTILPAVLHFAVYSFLLHKEYVSFSIDLIYFAYQFGLLIFITLLSRLILWKRL
jgi:hypothetical protein